MVKISEARYKNKLSAINRRIAKAEAIQEELEAKPKLTKRQQKQLDNQAKIIQRNDLWRVNLYQDYVDSFKGEKLADLWNTVELELDEINMAIDNNISVDLAKDEFRVDKLAEIIGKLSVKYQETGDPDKVREEFAKRFDMTEAIEGSHINLEGDLKIDDKDVGAQIIDDSKEIGDKMKEAFGAGGYKASLSIVVQIEQDDKLSELTFHSDTIIVLSSDDMRDVIVELTRSALDQFRDMENPYAGKIVGGVSYEFQASIYSPLKARGYFPSPDGLQNKGTINPNNKDENCFYYAVMICHHNLRKDRNRVSKIDKLMTRYKYNALMQPMQEEDRMNKLFDYIQENRQYCEDLPEYSEFEAEETELVRDYEDTGIMINTKLFNDLESDFDKLYQPKTTIKEEDICCIGIHPKSYMSPMPICGEAYQRFEKLNDHLSLNVYSWVNHEPVLTYISHYPTRRNPERQDINVLIIRNDRGDMHYIAITDIIKLLNRGEDRRRDTYCLTCNIDYLDDARFKAHDCDKRINIKMPKEGAVKEFTRYKNTIKQPFTVSCKINTMITGGVHKPTGYCLMLNASKERFNMPPIIKNGLRCMSTFWASLDKIKKHIDECYEVAKLESITRSLNPVEEHNHENADCCMMCQKPFEMIEAYKMKYCEETPTDREQITNLSDSHAMKKAKAEDAANYEKYLAKAKVIPSESTRIIRDDNDREVYEFIDSFIELGDEDDFEEYECERVRENIIDFKARETIIRRREELHKQSCQSTYTYRGPCHVNCRNKQAKDSITHKENNLIGFEYNGEDSELFKDLYASYMTPIFNTETVSDPIGLSGLERLEYEEATECDRCGNPFDDYRVCGFSNVKSIARYHGQYTGAVHYKCRSAGEGLVKLTKEEKEHFNTTDKCYVCAEGFEMKLNKEKLFDRLTNKYIGAVDKECFSKAISMGISMIPVIIEDLCKLEAHLIIKSFGDNEEESVKRKISCISDGNNVITFNVGRFRFVDSKRFINDSISVISSQIDSNHLKMTRGMFLEYDGYNKSLPYPHRYMDNKDKFMERSLPPIEEFYNQMEGLACDQYDYDNARYCWIKYSCLNLAKYQQVYMLRHCCLLSDIMNYFRDIHHKSSGLDPVHYSGLMGFSDDCLYRTTKAQIELITDYDMYATMEKSIRGGINLIGQRYAKANNPSVPDYDETKPTTHIVKDDYTSFYGYIMQMPMPTGGYKNMDYRLDSTNPTTIEALVSKFVMIPDDAPIGYKLTISGYWPDECHDELDELPPLSEYIEINHEMLSDHNNYDLFRASKKLVQSHLPKEDYTLDYRMLRFCLNKGFKLTAITNVIQFNQSKWMSPYIEKYSNLRGQAKCDFEGKMYKALLVGPFGKSFENPRKYKDYKFITTKKELLKATRCSEFVRVSRIYNRNLIGVIMGKKSINLCSTIIVGSTILDLSKLHLLLHHYGYIKERYPGKKSILLNAVTDSLSYLIQTDDVKKDRKDDSDIFVYSNYPKDSPYYSDKNHKVPGYLTDEFAGRTCAEFIGLGCNMTSYKMVETDDIMKSSRIKEVVSRDNFTHETYRSVLETGKAIDVIQYNNRVKDHVVTNMPDFIVGLNAADYKRYNIDNYHSRAYGHYLNGQNIKSKQLKK